MGVRPKIVKEDQIEFNVNLVKIWESIVEYRPDALKDPVDLFNIVLKWVNQILIIYLFAIMIGQTVHILNGSERRYINLRHLLIKWIFLFITFLLADHIKKHTSHDELFVLMCSLVALGMVYPSKFIKNLHLKYFSFSERKRNDEAGDDLTQLQMSLTARILSSVTVFFLDSSRFIITFIHPQHRKKIEEAMRGVNMVIVEEKYFWKMYDSSNKNSVVMPQVQDPILHQSGSNIGKPPMLNKFDLDSAKVKSQKSMMKDNVIRAKVSEYIQIPLSTGNTPGDKKYTFYRNVQMNYYPDLYQLVVVSEEDGKSTTHTLEEISEEGNLMMRLQLQNEEDPAFFKFKLKKDYDLFLNTIYLSAEHLD